MKPSKSIHSYGYARTTLSSVKRLEKRAHVISRDISACQREVEYHLSRINWARASILRLQEEHRAVTEHIALKTGTSLKRESSPEIVEVESSPETNLPQNLETEFSQEERDFYNSLTTIPEPTGSLDINCYEILSPSPVPSPARISGWNGFMENLAWENLDWPMTSSQEPISRTQEQSGGTDTYWSEIASSTTLDPTV